MPLSAFLAGSVELRGGAPLTLNAGCRTDLWGDVCLGAANILVDVHYLSFRKNSFSQVRAWHLLEHCRNSGRALQELKHVARIVHARFPCNSGPMPYNVLNRLFSLNAVLFIRASIHPYPADLRRGVPDPGTV